MCIYYVCPLRHPQETTWYLIKEQALYNYAEKPIGLKYQTQTMPDHIFEAAPYMKNKCNSMKYHYPPASYWSSTEYAQDIVLIGNTTVCSI